MNMSPPPEGGFAGGASGDRLVVERLARMVSLMDRLASLPRNEAGFEAVQGARDLFRCTLSFLYLEDPPRIECVSGAGLPDADAPLSVWMRKLVRTVEPHEEAQAFDRADLPPPVQDPWPAPWPDYGLCAPLRTPGGRVGTWVVMGETPWSRADATALGSMAHVLARVLITPDTPRPSVWRRLDRWKWWAVVACALFLLLPVRSFVVAPAEVVPVVPMPVRAPIAGTVANMAVAPNMAVHAGDVVTRFDRAVLQSERDAASHELEVARTRYSEALQGGMDDAKVRSEIGPLQARVGEQEAELRRRQWMLDHADVRSPGDGVVIYDDPADWMGRPVEKGEKLALLAQPESTRIAIHVPAAEMIALADDAPVQFFDDLRPDRPHRGHLVFRGYFPETSAQGVASVLLRADLDGAAIRLGTKGEARILGGRRPLVLWLLHRPIFWLRPWLGL